MIPRAALVVGCLVASSCGGHQVLLTDPAPATFADEPGGYEEASVTRVVDGDTIDVEILARAEGPGAGSADSGPTYRVRLIGIDTPESVKSGSPVECFGREASAAAKALLKAGPSVWSKTSRKRIGTTGCCATYTWGTRWPTRASS